jgi:hypothetical protein
MIVFTKKKTEHCFLRFGKAKRSRSIHSLKKITALFLILLNKKILIVLKNTIFQVCLYSEIAYNSEYAL